MRGRALLLGMVCGCGVIVACGESKDTETRDTSSREDGGGSAASPDAGPSAPPDAGPDAPPSDPTAAVAAFDQALAKAVCGRLADCCKDSDYQAFFAQFQDKPYTLKAPPARDACESTLRAQLGVIHGKWAASAKKGRVTFDAARAGACVSGIAGAACGLALTSALYDPKCLGIRGNEVFTKITPVGAACEDIGDATFYGECDPTKGFCGTSKTCEPWRKVGESCQTNPRQFCAPSLYCDSFPLGKCVVPRSAKLDELCIDGDEVLDCAAGTRCDFDTKRCVAKKPAGADCKLDDDCLDSRPFSCSPFGAGTCGSTTYCSGK